MLSSYLSWSQYLFLLYLFTNKMTAGQLTFVVSIRNMYLLAPSFAVTLQLSFFFLFDVHNLAKRVQSTLFFLLFEGCSETTRRGMNEVLYIQ